MKTVAKNPHAVAPCCRRCSVKLPRDPFDIYALLGYCVKCLPWQCKRPEISENWPENATFK